MNSSDQWIKDQQAHHHVYQWNNLEICSIQILVSYNRCKFFFSSFQFVYWTGAKKSNKFEFNHIALDYYHPNIWAKSVKHSWINLFDFFRQNAVHLNSFSFIHSFKLTFLSVFEGSAASYRAKRKIVKHLWDSTRTLLVQLNIGPLPPTAT